MLIAIPILQGWRQEAERSIWNARSGTLDLERLIWIEGIT
jgi:hypothetical protein